MIGFRALLDACQGCHREQVAPPTAQGLLTLLRAHRLPAQDREVRTARRLTISCRINALASGESLSVAGSMPAAASRRMRAKSDADPLSARVARISSSVAEIRFERFMAERPFGVAGGTIADDPQLFTRQVDHYRRENLLCWMNDQRKNSLQAHPMIQVTGNIAPICDIRLCLSQPRLH